MAPVLWAKAQDSRLPFFTTYRNIPRNVMKPPYPLLLIGETIQCLRMAKIYSQPEIDIVCNMILMIGRNECYLVFHIGYSLYEPTFTPFRTLNALASMPVYSHNALWKALNNFALTYFDDV